MKRADLIRLAGKGLGVAVLAAALAGGARAADTPGPAMLPVGSQAPDFEAVDLGGNPFDFSSERGKSPFFLVFWSIF